MEHRFNCFAGESAQLDRALDLLELLADSGRPLKLVELTHQTSAPKASVHRLLATLLARGYVTQDPRSSTYSAGVRCFELGGLWAQNSKLRAIASPHTATLNEDTRETVHLAVYDHGDSVSIDKWESPHAVIARTHVGRRYPAFCVASGRVLLAFQPVEEITRRLAEPLTAYTPASITDPSELTALLEQVRRSGYATNFGGYREGICGVGAPIRDYTGGVVASVSVCLPEYRFGPGRVEELTAAVVATAAAISGALSQGPLVLEWPGSDADAAGSRL